MKPVDCVKLENDKKFKKKYLVRTAWWKNLAVVAPSLILFLGLFGLLYLTKYDMLLSYYSIPFVIVFLFGTIWLKSVKRYVQNKKMEDVDAFKVCFAKSVKKDKRYTYFIFTKGQKRHNEYFIKELSRIVDVDKQTINCKKKAVSLNLPDDLSEEACFIIAYPTLDIKKQNVNWDENCILPILYIDNENVFIIKGKDIL